MKLYSEDIKFDIECFDPLAFILMSYLYPDITEDEAYRPLKRLSSWITPKDVEDYYRDNFDIDIKLDSISFSPHFGWSLSFTASTGDVLYIKPSIEQIGFFAGNH